MSASHANIHPEYMTELLVGYLLGYAKQSAEFIRVVTPSMRRWAKRCGASNSDIDDVTQRVLMTLLKSPGRFRPEGKPLAFLYLLTQEAVRAVQRDIHSYPSTMPVSSDPTEPGFRQPFHVPLRTQEEQIEQFASYGYGSPAHIEATCDSRHIMKAVDQPMKLALVALGDGASQVEAANIAGMDRFKLKRNLGKLQSNLRLAA